MDNETPMQRRQRWYDVLQEIRNANHNSEVMTPENKQAIKAALNVVLCGIASMDSDPEVRLRETVFVDVGYSHDRASYRPMKKALVAYKSGPWKEAENRRPPEDGGADVSITVPRKE